MRFDEALQQWLPWSDDQSDKKPKPPPSYFMDFSAEHKKRVVRWVASSLGSKYRVPFTEGRLNVVNLLGSESWADYGQVVMLMMMADSLASIEAKLDKLTDLLPEKASE